MKSTWSRSVQMTLCAAAICAMGAVNAQTPQAPASVGTPQSSTQTPSQASPSQARGTEGNMTEGRKGERHHRAHKGERHKGEHQQRQRGKYADPHQHEAAAVRAEERAGRLRGGEQGMDQYQRNALARCEVFREMEDRQSCANRVRSSDVSGSVRDGGVLREYTEQVPVRN
ncbi:hypothetical protein [Comamonas endophytica]|uniref:Uncharacterized protein n=1 Tax=Comamonas endophytica TaxID=2949090 RepID=A0ABY6GBE3_9BURK|nr:MULTISPECIES: hypothetical protein [unclassified Acidovorax]MCD2513973.1 hypothetical protein [Acidovorax sp. D4N7]UYG52035.1 hypothetical protein M9799_01965 [Acidovorax sp. 5MLIR]